MDFYKKPTLYVYQCTRAWRAVPESRSSKCERINAGNAMHRTTDREVEEVWVGLNLKQDIVSIATDGASVMTKVGRCIEAEQQLCYAHGVQLAVLDVLYKKPQVAQAQLQALVDVVDDQESDDDNDDSEMNCAALESESDGIMANWRPRLPMPLKLLIQTTWLLKFLKSRLL